MELTKHQSYVPKSVLVDLIDEVNLFIKSNYLEHNLARGAAYLSDSKPGRVSYAFNVRHSSNIHQRYFDLPSVDIPTTYISLFTDKMYDILGLNKTSRVLFNIQKYYSDNEEVVKHYDGHYFKFDHDEKGNLNIIEALRPKHVAVLTLLNNVKGAGTRVWSDGDDSGKVIESYGGDLFVFNNWDNLHGADAFKAKSKRKDNLVRMTVGWRSIEDKCKYVSDVPEFNNREISLELAQSLHRDWLEIWPAKWEEIKKLNKQAAF